MKKLVYTFSRIKNKAWEKEFDDLINKPAIFGGFAAASICGYADWRNVKKFIKSLLKP